VNREAIRVAGLEVWRAGKLVLAVPELAVGEGEVLALIGPNGSGKSTLLQALALLLPARMEGYWLAGRQAQLPEEELALRRQMAVVFQQPLLLNAGVMENVTLGLRFRGMPRDEAEQRAAVWLEKLGVAALVGRRAHTLSGGEAQRVSLARALVLEPRLLFLDEPFGALDLLTREALIRDLRRVLPGAGVTTLFATHDYLEVLLLADRVAVLDRGEVVQLGEPEALFAKPASPTVRELTRAADEMLQALRDRGVGGQAR
jgi:tungstate transport system ATP-binding protein